jgi:hypothetical protein
MAFNIPFAQNALKMKYLNQCPPEENVSISGNLILSILPRVNEKTFFKGQSICSWED